MASERDIRRTAYVSKVAAEVARLENAGVVLAGNAFSSVCFLKGDLSAEERGGAALLSGRDGDALRASLVAPALGYEPEDWCAAATARRDGTLLDARLLRQVVAVLDPVTLIACDESAAHAVREAYPDELASLPDIQAAELGPGYVVQVKGMRVLNLGGFAAALDDPHRKQVMWAYLKQVPPQGEPY